MSRHIHVPGLGIASMILLAAICLPIVVFPSAVFADWGPDIQLSSNSSHAVSAGVAVSGNYVHTCWMDDKSGNDEIYYRRSADGGATWGNETTLTSDPADSNGPRIAASGSYVYIVWNDDRDGTDEIYFKCSIDNGANWGPDTRLSDLPDNSSYASIAVSGNNIHIIWIDRRHGNREVYYKRSTDNGATWGPDTLLTASLPGFSQEPEVAASGNNVYVAWEYVTIGGNYDIYFKCSTDNGATWDPDRQLTTDPNTAWYVSLAVSGNIVLAAWDDDRDGDREIYYKRSDDGGTTWGADTRLTNEPSEQHQVNIATSGSNAFVAWTDDRAGTNELVYYRQSTDTGLTWGAETCLTDTAVFCEDPFAFLSGNTVHIVWSDVRTGVYEAYYKRFPAIAAPTITSFTPTSGNSGTVVIITGRNFLGATVVSFGGTAATSFTVNSDTQITATVGSGATGRITITNPSGTGTSAADFTFTSPVNFISTISPHGSSMTGLTAAPPQSPVILPTVSVRSASLSATRVAPGTAITVMADVVNTGTVNGSSSIKVYVNGELENSRGVTVNSGSSTPVTFNVSRNEPGTYSVYVGGTQAGNFTVDQFADSNIILYISGALVLFALILGVVYITRRRTC